MESLAEHVDILLALIGSLLCIVGWGIQSSIARVESLIKLLFKKYDNLDNQVTALNTRCQIFHNSENSPRGGSSPIIEGSG